MWRALFLACGLTACTQFPELDDAVSPRAQRADYPALVPLDPLLARADGTRTAPDTTATNVTARTDALRARAARLRARPVIDSATRRRMADGAG